MGEHLPFQDGDRRRVEGEVEHRRRLQELRRRLANESLQRGRKLRWLEVAWARRSRRRRPAGVCWLQLRFTATPSQALWLFSPPRGELLPARRRRQQFYPLCDAHETKKPLIMRMAATTGYWCDGFPVWLRGASMGAMYKIPCHRSMSRIIFRH